MSITDQIHTKVDMGALLDVAEKGGAADIRAAIRSLTNRPEHIRHHLNGFYGYAVIPGIGVFTIRSGRWTSDVHDSFEMSGAGDLLLLRLGFAGEYEWAANAATQQHIAGSELRFEWYPALKATDRLSAAGTRAEDVHIQVRRSTLIREFDLDPDQFDGQLARLLGGEGALPLTLHYPLEPAIAESALALLRNHGSDPISALRRNADALMCLVKVIEFLRAGASASPLKSSSVTPFARASSILRARYADPPGIDELAAEVAVSRSTLIRGFRQCFGMSIREFRSQVRVDVADVLLHNTDQSITVIADRLGYASASNFCRDFRRCRGQSPKQARSSASVAKVK